MIIRGERPEANYTIIENKLLNNPDLDWREMGLLIYLLSKPDNWQVSIAHLAKQKSAGESSIKAAIKNLKEAGYIESKRNHTGLVDWFVYDSPRKPATSHDEPREPIKPQVEKPHVEKPQEENHRLINTDLKTNKEKENNCAPDFDAFWDTYGFKKDRTRAERAWKKLSDTNKGNAIRLIPAFKRSLPEWHQLPYPATYLNGERWNDDLTPAPEEVNGQKVIKTAAQKRFEPEPEFKRAAPTNNNGERVRLKDLVNEAKKKVA